MKTKSTSVALFAYSYLPNIVQIKKTTLSLIFAVLCMSMVYAEGTRELSPNGQITVTDSDGNTVTTTDIAALNIGNEQYNFFAGYNQPGSSRLNIFITDPSNESIYLGFSEGHINQDGSGALQKFRYYIYDPNGNIIYTSGIIGDTEAANISDWQSAFNGPSAFDPDGYDAVVLDSDVLSSQGFTGPGDYYIEFEVIDRSTAGANDFENSFLLIDFWDITVSDNLAGEKRNGRLWSDNWGLFAINDFGFPNRPFNGSFFVCAPDPADPESAYVTKIDFNDAGFRPGGFNIAFNSFGIDNSLPFPESASSFNHNGGDPADAENKSVPEYEVFLNDPLERCKTAEAGMLALDGITRCDGQVSYCIQFRTNKPGDVSLLLDFDGQDEIFTAGTRDLRISRTIAVNEVTGNICIDWDGRDGLGDVVTGDVFIVLSYEEGRYNFPIYDAEYLENGFTVESVRPAGSEPLLYYDDRTITDDPGTGQEKDRRAGCAQRCHTWNTFDNSSNTDQSGYGNLNTINTWWYSDRVLEKQTVELPAVLTCELNGPDGFCDNEEAVITLELIQSPEDSESPEVTNVTWEGPGIVDSNNDQLTVNMGGTYTATVDWSSPTGEMCSSKCSYDIATFPTAEVKIDTTIEFNTSIEIAGNVYDQTTVDTLEFQTVNGCDSLVVVCVTVETPDVLLECELSGPDGICAGDTGVVQLTVTQTPPNGPAPVVDSIVWSGAGIVSSNDMEATVEGGDTYSATIYYTNELGARETSCEVVVEQYPTPQVKIDTTIEFDSSIEIGGVVYDATTVDTLEFQTVNGCDSTVVVCVTVEIPEVELTCTLDGPAGLCDNETGIVTLTTSYTPANAPEPIINSITWSNNVISTSNDDTEATVNGGDTYTVTVNYTDLMGDVKEAICDISLDEYPTFEVKIDTIIEAGQVITINGQDYDSEGIFVDEGQTVNGCDSTLIICVVPEDALICYDLDDCKSIDYSRFTPKILEDFDCADVTASTVYRVDPQRNGHSCTEGVNGSVAMCVSSVENCEYDAGNEKSVIIDVAIQPLDGNAVRVTSLTFFERAPEEYVWTNERSGINNYPTLYGVRVLKNGEEVFRSEGEATSFDWTLERFSFSGNSEFVVDQPAVFRFELLGYCTVGADSYVTAWDLDDIKINANCAENTGNMVAFSGEINNIAGEPLENVELSLDTDSGLNSIVTQTLTDSEGKFAFENLPQAHNYSITPKYDRNHLYGVTTADLIHIQRHILGMAKFDSPYQMIAADVDRSNSITALDLLELRKLILGVTNEIANNESYRFGYAAQELTVENPWIIEESSNIINPEVDRLKENFRAIKIGDVSVFNGLNSSSTSSNKSLNGNIEMRAEDAFVKSGESTVVNFSLNSDELVKGIQMSIDMHDIQSFEVFGLGEYGVSYFYNAKGDMLNISFISSENNSGNIEFELHITSERSAWLSDILSLTENSIPATAYLGEDLLEKNIVLVFNSSASSDNSVNEKISISPNPFSEILNVQIDSENESYGNIKILDVSGRLLYSNTIQLNTGINGVDIQKQDIQNYKGLMFISITQGSTITTQRIISL